MPAERGCAFMDFMYVTLAKRLSSQHFWQRHLTHPVFCIVGRSYDNGLNLLIFAKAR